MVSQYQQQGGRKQGGKKPSKTAQLIQDAATDMFAKQGYDGTIMDELAAVTGANKASIYYHFQTKQGLYEACMTALFSGVANQVLMSIDEGASVFDKLETFVVEFSKAAYHKPQMPAVLMREMASGGENMPVPARLQMQRLLFGLKELIEEGVALGAFVRVHPLTLHMMIVGSLSLYIASEPLRKKIDAPEQDPSVVEMTAEVVQMIQRALRQSK